MIPASSKTGRRSSPARSSVAALAAIFLAVTPDPTTVVAAAPPPGSAVPPAPVAAAPAAERCVACHAKVTQGRVVHGALDSDCDACHRPVAAEGGKCASRTASRWALVEAEPGLCYQCHDRKDQQKSVHSAIRDAGCLSCHAAHASEFAGLTTRPHEQLCLDCHEVAPLLAKPVRHAPVAEGRCLGCHDPHGGKLPKNVREGGTARCLSCHDATAPAERGAPGPGYRIDRTKKVVHGASDCLDCHEGGHGSDNLKLLQKAPAELCYGCHDRMDAHPFTHGAVVLGDCAVCHDPHGSDTPKLLAKATIQETCFTCHQDDLTGRKVIHAPVTMGCDECHDPHGAKARNALKIGEGKAGCYTCHGPVDTGKNKHAALERYGCTGCHDPHGTGYGALMPRPVNEVCAACHEAQKDGRHVTSIIPNGHVVGGDLNDPKREGRDFSCASCHDPHGSDGPKLLRAGPTPMDSCAWCHGDKSGERPELRNVVSRAKRGPATPRATGIGSPGGGAPAPAGDPDGSAARPAPGGGRAP